MKRKLYLVIFVLIVSLAASHWLGWPAAAETPTPQPIYVYLTSGVSDYVNHDISDERLRRVLSMLGKYRKQNPSTSATIFLSGAMSADLEQRNSETHLLDLVRGSVKRGVIEAGYDGSLEPGDKHHPLVDFSKAKTPEERWLQRVAFVEEALTEARDPKTGEVVPGKTGGLKKTQELFGPVAAMRGVFVALPNMYGANGQMMEVGSDSEIVHVIGRYNKGAILPGVTQRDWGHIGESGYVGWIAAFSRRMSPDPQTPPELFWQDDILRSSEASGRDLRIFQGTDGVEKLKAVLAAMDRSRVRILHVEIGGELAYEKRMGPPLPGPTAPMKYASDHPDQAQYAAELRNSPAEIEDAYGRQDAVMNYLVSEFFAANPGSRFVSNTDLKQMTPAGWGYDLQVASLRDAVAEKLKAWGDNKTPPTSLTVDGHYLSDADMFEVLADTLAQMDKHPGKPPRTVRVARVYGPMETVAPTPPVAGELTAAAVAKACAEMLPALHDDKWSPVPHNAIPSQITVDGLTVNPAQFLRLMAEALGAPSAETKLEIKPITMFWGREAIYYRRRPLGEMGAAWTYKPAPVGQTADQSAQKAKRSAD